MHVCVHTCMDKGICVVERVFKKKKKKSKSKRAMKTRHREKQKKWQQM